MRSHYDGHVDPGGAPAIRTVRHHAGAITVTKLSVGPMDNNCYVLADHTTGTGIVIDAADDADRVLDAIGDVDITAIVTTHGHRDHWQGLGAVARATGARVLYHPDDGALIPVPFDGTVTHGDRVTVGTAAVEVIHAPGHTDGSVCVLLHGEDDDHGATAHLFTGDTLFPGGPGKTNNPTQFAQIMRSLRERLFVLDDDTWVYPGHGDDTTLGAERPHLDEWQERGW
jgi:glyoxylase-like metal-dependent hydrolase (beta-lactamase superfamily II)